MFGYIRVSKPELRIKEYDMYKAVYCTLCKQVGKKYGFFARFTLSYDFTFLSLLCLSLKEGNCEIKRGRCVCNPLKKCNYCTCLSDFGFPSAAAMILLKYKLKDDISDEKGIKKFSAVLLSFVFGGAFKKAIKEYPQIENVAKIYFEEQSKAEENKSNLDLSALPSENMLSTLLSFCSEDEKEKRVLKNLGKMLGRYIYILDAAIDYDKDKKENKYNPFISESRQEAIDHAKIQLYIAINEAVKSFELLDIKKYKNILGNIIYVGLEDTLLKELR